MAIPGDRIAASARASAVALIERISGSAGASAAGAAGAIDNAHTIVPNILRSTDAQVADFNRFLQHPVVWANDMNCYARASVGARHINEVLGHGLSPTDDAFNAAIAILEAPPNRGWSFHAGVAMRDSAGDVKVIDHLTRSEPMLLEDWARTYGVEADKTFLVSPWAGSKVKSNTADAGTWRWIDDALTSTWERPTRWGVDVRGGLGR